MIRYKGFLIENCSIQQEGRTPGAGSCNAEGNGIFTTHYYTKIIDLKTLKTISAESEADAKKTIDEWFSPNGKAKTKIIEQVIKEKELLLKEIELEVASEIETAQRRLAAARRALYEAQDKRPPRFY